MFMCTCACDKNVPSLELERMVSTALFHLFLLIKKFAGRTVNTFYINRKKKEIVYNVYLFVGRNRYLSIVRSIISPSLSIACRGRLTYLCCDSLH